MSACLFAVIDHTSLCTSLMVKIDSLNSLIVISVGSSSHVCDVFQVNLPLQGNVQELQGGKEWLNAVSEAMAFEREHPAWFEEKFGRLVDTSDKDKPDYDTQVGCD